MIRNNMKIGFRNLRKNKLYTSLNTAGLAIGIAACLLIYHMIQYELGFNKEFENYDRITRVVHIDDSSIDGPHYNVCVPIPAMDQIEEKVSQFEYMTRIKELFSTLTVPYEGSTVPLKKFNQSRFETAIFAEPNFLKIFSFNWLAGDPSTAITEPGSIVLTRSWAEKCFDKWEDAMGKRVMIDNLVPVEVKGIIEDVGSNTDFPIPFIVSYETLKNNKELFFFQESWGSCSSNNQVFGLLQKGVSIEEANQIVAQIGKDEYSEVSGEQTRIHHLQPLSEIHYDERFSHSGTHTVSKGRLKVLGIIGILILLIGCFNFINLSTAQSLLRAKEVGVRKTLGSSRFQLITQFIGETGIIVTGALIIGTYLAYLSIPLLKYVSYVPEGTSLFSNSDVLLFLVLSAIGITFLAGLYPAFALSKFQPVQALNSMSQKGAFGAIAMRKSLVILQFGAALALIISAIIILQQLDYMRTQDLGFEDDYIYTFEFNNDENTLSRQEGLRTQLKNIPGVLNVTFSSDQPMSGNTWSTNFKYSTRPTDEDFEMSLRFCDQDYFETYAINFLAGQAFKPSDTMRQCVVNMTVLKKLGILNPAEAIGQNIRLGGGRRNLEITGVVRDFHTHSFREAHEPLLLTTRKQFYGNAGVKIRSENVAATIGAIQSAFDEVLSEQVFEGQFLDDNIARFYENDNRLSATCWTFGFLAIFISCLGLFGLATHAVTQRIKEIGIRKVLGANVGSLVALLSRDFIKLVLVSLLIASPIAWWLMEKWLNNFAFRIEIQPWIFLLAGLIAVSIAFITVSYQSIKAAIANPISALKDE